MGGRPVGPTLKGKREDMTDEQVTLIVGAMAAAYREAESAEGESWLANYRTRIGVVKAAYKLSEALRGSDAGFDVDAFVASFWSMVEVGA